VTNEKRSPFFKRAPHLHRPSPNAHSLKSRAKSSQALSVKARQVEIKLKPEPPWETEEKKGIRK